MIVSTSTDAKPDGLPSYLPLRTTHRREAVRIEHALARAPILANLAQRAKQSAACLSTITPLIPVGMRQSIQAGPLEEGCWCVLVPNSAYAAKLRQLAPALTAHLRQHNLPVSELRIKIAMPSTR